jgi:hypothetical protein
MRADLVVFASPLLDAHAGFSAARKPVHVEALVAKLPVEALVTGTSFYKASAEGRVIWERENRD